MSVSVCVKSPLQCSSENFSACSIYKGQRLTWMLPLPGIWVPQCLTFKDVSGNILPGEKHTLKTRGCAKSKVEGMSYIWIITWFVESPSGTTITFSSSQMVDYKFFAWILSLIMVELTKVSCALWVKEFIFYLERVGKKEWGKWATPSL